VRRTLAIVTGGAIASQSAASARIEGIREAFERRDWTVVTNSRYSGHKTASSRLSLLRSHLTSARLAKALTRLGFVGEVRPTAFLFDLWFLRQNPHDVVLISMPPLATVRIARKGRPIILDYRDVFGAADYPSVTSRVLRPFEAAAARRAAYVSFAGSATTGERLVGRLGVQQADLIHVRNGVMPSELPTGPVRATRRRGADLVFAGNLYGASDLSPLFRALLAGPHDARLEILTAGTLASVRRYLSEAPTGRVVVSSAVTRSALYRRLDLADAGVIVLNRDYPFAESIPAKTYDYLAMGLPILYLGPADAALMEEGGGLIHRFDPNDLRGIIGFLEALRDGSVHAPRRPFVVDRIEEANKIVDAAERLLRR